MKLIFYLFSILTKETIQSEELATQAANHLKNEVPYKGNDAVFSKKNIFEAY